MVHGRSVPGILSQAFLSLKSKNVTQTRVQFVGQKWGQKDENNFIKVIGSDLTR